MCVGGIYFARYRTTYNQNYNPSIVMDGILAYSGYVIKPACLKIRWSNVIYDFRGYSTTYHYAGIHAYEIYSHNIGGNSWPSID